MDIGTFLPLPLGTRGYLIYQALGSVVVNAAINFGFAWPMHEKSWIPMFGWGATVAFDTCLTAVLLSALTVLSGSWFVRRDHERGVVRAIDPSHGGSLRRLPLGTMPRALLFAVLFGALSIPIALGSLVLLGYEGMTFAQFLPFKLGFAIALGVLVTPLNAALVLLSLSRGQPSP